MRSNGTPALGLPFRPGPSRLLDWAKTKLVPRVAGTWEDHRPCLSPAADAVAKSGMEQRRKPAHRVESG